VSARLTPRGMSVLAAGAALAGAGVGVWLSPTRATVERSAYDVCVEAAMSAPGYAVEVCEPLGPWTTEIGRRESAREDSWDAADEPQEDEPGWDCRVHGNRDCGPHAGCTVTGNLIDCREVTP
jgi:hypothetical protein